MRSAGWIAATCVSVVLLPTTIKGQTVLLPGSGMQVLPGTTVRVAGNTTWQLPAGSQLINDGTIVVGASGSLSEAEGAAILGSGVERTTRTYGAPLTGEDPAGLGMVLDLPGVPDTVTVVRGHMPRTDTAGRTSVARWYELSVSASLAPGSSFRFRYDPTELGGLSENDLAGHRRLSADTLWEPLLSTPDPAVREVAVILADSTGTFTLFEGGIISGTPDHRTGRTVVLYPNPASDRFLVRSDRTLGTVELFDAGGRLMHRWSLPPGQQAAEFDLGDLAPGAYQVVIDRRHQLTLIVE